MPSEKLTGEREAGEANKEASKGRVLDSGLSLVQWGALEHGLYVDCPPPPAQARGWPMSSHISVTLGVGHPRLGV